MSNTLYPSALDAFANGDIDWNDPGTTFKVYLLDSSYSYSAAHDFLNDVTGILGTPQALTGRTILSGGVCDADDVSYPDVNIGETVARIVIAIDTGTPSTSRLIYFADSNNDTTPIARAGDGSAIPLVWTGSGVFRL